MYNLDETIDSIQNSKKTFVTNMVKDSEIAGNINDLVDAQTAYTKAVAKTAEQTLQRIGKEIMAGSAEVTKLAKQALEQVSQNTFVKELQEKATKDFYDSFWREAMKWYQTGQGTAKKTTVEA